MKIYPYRTIILFFILTIFLATVLISLPGTTTRKISFIDKLFTVTSSVCVTGLTVVDISNTFTKFGQIIILSCIQIGGLGYMLLASVAILLFGRISLSQKSVVSESLNLSEFRSFSQLVPMLKQILFFTLLFEFIGTILLTIKFRCVAYPWNISLYYSIFHSISAFCNAGFTLFTNSLEQFKSDLLINIVIPLLIISGGLGFIVWINILECIKKKSNLSLHSKLVILTTTILLIVGTVCLYLLNMEKFNNMKLTFKEKFLISWFQAVTPRTAGFNTIPIRELSEVTIMLLMCLMFIGASPGGTGGGIKTTTFFVVIYSIYSFFRGNKDVAIFKRRIKFDIVMKSFAIFFSSLIFILFISSILKLISPFSFKECLFEIVSAFGTVGLSLGITPNLDNVGKILVILTMLVGRVGSLTMFTLLLLHEPKEIKYLEESIAVG